MFYHLKIMLRSLRRNLTYSAINIAGLAISMTAAVLIFIWVHHERSFDKYHPDAERIYRIINTAKFEGRPPMIIPSTSYPFIQSCKNEIPEIENVYMLYYQRYEAITVNNTVFSVKGNAFCVDRAWLEMFHSQLLDGSFEAFGNHPYSVALTESGAKKYFGDLSATGQTIRINNADYMVQAVVKDNPTNSSFRYHIMLSADAVLSDNDQSYLKTNWGAMNWMVFVKLHPNADISQVAQKMNDINTKNEVKINLETSLQLLTDIHFEPVVMDLLVTGGNRKTVSIFTLLGILLLCTACINYVNLTTAKVNQRAKEVGVKKIVGAKRRSLFLQFVAESLILSLMATVLALYMILLLSGQFQSLAGNMALSFSSPVIWIITGVVLLFVTVLNGIYPALMLSSFQPLHTLKGMSLLKIKDSSLRKALVIFQFTLSAAMIISVNVIYKQMLFIQHSPGYAKEQIVQVEIPIRTLRSFGENAELSLQSIKGELQSCPDIVGVALSSGHIENILQATTGNADWNGRPKDFEPLINVMSADEDYMRIFELQLTEGRWFDGATDMQNIILNETAIRELGIQEPYLGQRFDFRGAEGNIIGIIKDFHFKSMYEKVTPLVLHHNQSNSIIAFKIQSGKSLEAIHEAETVWNKFFPNDPFEYAFLDDSFNNLYKADMRTSRLILIFSILAVVIAMLGLFGLSTFAIERRTKEIGIRKVLGASAQNIVYLLTRDFFVLVAIAFVIAAPLSWWAMNRWLTNYAYRISFTVWIFIAGAAITAVVALAAVGIQAIKAATADPVKSIKIE